MGVILWFVHLIVLEKILDQILSSYKNTYIIKKIT